MIASFTIHNYRSILEATLNFRYPHARACRNRDVREIYPFFQVKTKEETARLLPCLGIWGPNGSGKSNLFRALRLFQEVILNGQTLPLPRLYEPNRLVAGPRPTRFELQAYLPYKRKIHNVIYRLTYDETRILDETLTCDGTSYLSRENLGPCELALSHCKAPWINILRQHFCIIDVWSMTGNGYGKHIFALAQQLHEDPTLFIEKVSAIVARLDVGIHKLELLTAPDAPPLVVTYHTNTLGEEVCFDINEESDGTQRILFLVAELLAALTKGQTIIADEMDRSIHPILFRTLIRMCKSKAYNHGKGQICFSTHDLSLMEASTIAPEEVVLVGKRGVETRIETLSSLVPGRSSAYLFKRFRERYLEGWYQNIPYPSL
ncbi:MAG: AAA family ATPase [bacterium]|nr:AAA family ATPase [bacterium]